jgi:hypothetical protein
LKSIFSFFVLVIATDVLCAQLGSGHKSEAEIVRMTVEQHIEEYWRENSRHQWHDNYQDLIESYISRDGLKAVPCLAKVIDEYDPTRRETRSKRRGDRCGMAGELLGRLDANVVRLRASEIGRAAIGAMRRAVQRMQGAHFDAAASYEYEDNLYQLSLATLRELEGSNDCDGAIKHTLELRYKISLSDKEMLDFVEYMISLAPDYPSWSQREEFKDMNQRNQAGNHIWYLILKTPEPFYKVYLQYKAKVSQIK